LGIFDTSAVIFHGHGDRDGEADHNKDFSPSPPPPPNPKLQQWRKGGEKREGLSHAMDFEGII
jgi:hypothetical protein